MILGSVARRYARALLELAIEDGIAERVETELFDFLGTIEGNPELGRTMLNPGFTVAQRRGLLDALLKGAGFLTVTGNFLRLLIDKNRIDHLPAIAREYRALHDAELGRLRASVRSAAPLADADVDQLRSLLESITGKQVLLDRAVDPELIGGIVTQVGGLMFDGSLRTQLRSLRQRLLRETA